MRPGLVSNLFLMAALALCAGLAGQAWAEEGAKAGRQLMRATGYPWQAIGRLNRRGKGFCSGALIGPKLVLTAAHCLYDRRRRRWLAAEDLHFVAGYRSGRYVFDAEAQAYQIAPGYQPGKAERNIAQAALDWALVTLEAEAGPEVGYFGIAKLNRLTPLPSPPNFTLAGYGRDRPYALAAHQGCRLLGWKHSGALIMHDCRAVSGTSGAPIIAEGQGHYLIYALHVGRAETADDILGGAVPSRSFFGAVKRKTGRGEIRLGSDLAIIPGRAGN